MAIVAEELLLHHMGIRLVTDASNAAISELDFAHEPFEAVALELRYLVTLRLKFGILRHLFRRF